MEIKNMSILFFLILSVCVSFCHGQIQPPVCPPALRTCSSGVTSECCEAVAHSDRRCFGRFGITYLRLRLACQRLNNTSPPHPSPPSATSPPPVCPPALRTCSSGVTSECCEAVTHADRSCFGRFGIAYLRLRFACQRLNNTSPPHPTPPSAPSPPSTPPRGTCPFAEACDVNFGIGRIPSYNTNNPQCCKMVQSTAFLQGQCFVYIPTFYRLKYVDCVSRPSPITP
ncbi:hypothetical protein M9H77_20147 [Catharanthus roseus]|uniref:Uncharacterized protein n=1 Tax=Catharanthus roseus TaxID=4058 RepID=A0ACC0AKY6_CATRO|nr:hypothetical protein M9H77_20147 [Catharanthus roseus]